jgi:hypothetical protein
MAPVCSRRTCMRLKPKHRATGSGPFYADRQNGGQCPTWQMLHPLRHGLGQVRRPDEMRIAMHDRYSGDRCVHTWLMVLISHRRGYSWPPSVRTIFLSGEPFGASISQDLMTARSVCAVRQLMARSCSGTRHDPDRPYRDLRYFAMHIDALMEQDALILLP